MADRRPAAILIALAWSLGVAAGGALAASTPGGALAASTPGGPGAAAADGAPLDTRASRWKAHQGRVVKAILFEGPTRTCTSRLRHFLDTRVGRPFDAERFAHDVRRIRNLELFHRIRVQAFDGDDGLVIQVHLEDKWSLLPYFSAFLNLGSVDVVAGLYDANTLGLLSYVDLQVMLFSYLPLTRESIRPGGALAIAVDRLGRLPLDYLFRLHAQSTLRTLFGSRGAVAGYLRGDHYGGRHSLTWEIYPFLRVGILQSLYYHRYRAAPDTETPEALVPDGGWSHLLGVRATLGHLSYQDYLMHGLRLALQVQGGDHWMGSSSRLVRLSGEARAFYRLGPRAGNLGARLGAGYAKGGDYADLFHLGSWTGFRGLYTQQLTARAYVLANIEYRTGVARTGFPIMSPIPYFRGKALGIQGAVFVDLGGLAGGGPWRTREAGALLASVGAGVRLMALKLYKAVFRLDFACVVSPYRSYDIIVATQQYF